MTLTTYLTQSVLCTVLFYPYGLGLYGRVTYAGMFAITLIVFSLQTTLSVGWLRRFRFGPAEWLWRTLAYGKAQPLRLIPVTTREAIAKAPADPRGNRATETQVNS